MPFALRAATSEHVYRYGASALGDTREEGARVSSHQHAEPYAGRRPNLRYDLSARYIAKGAKRADSFFCLMS